MEIVTAQPNLMKTSLSRTSPVAELRAFYTIVWREWLHFVRYPTWVIAFIIWPILFPAVYIFSSFALAGPGGAGIPRFLQVAGTENFLGYIVVGTTVWMWANTLLWNVGFALRGEQMRGTLESNWMTPTSRFLFLVGTGPVHAATMLMFFICTVIEFRIFFNLTFEANLLSMLVVFLAAMPALISGAVAPPTLLETGVRPSADLLIQEIRLRRESLALLIRDVERQKEKVERIPAGWPLVRRAGKFSSGFGYRLDPFTRRLDKHEGLDISAPYGTPVVATARGTVRFAAYKDAYGNMVVVDHGDGIQTAYAHLSAILVKPGDTVSRGQVIGKVGSTGRSTGNHLHYEVRLNNSPVNPVRYIAR